LAELEAEIVAVLAEEAERYQKQDLTCACGVVAELMGCKCAGKYRLEDVDAMERVRVVTRVAKALDLQSLSAYISCNYNL
jgi:hypothetical protein